MSPGPRKIRPESPFYSVLRKPRDFDPARLAQLFRAVDRDRVGQLARLVADYLRDNLPDAIEGKRELADYRLNPYVLMTSASTLQLDDPDDLAEFLFNTKIYMALETSFGKSLEVPFLKLYPFGSEPAYRWATPTEKDEEFQPLKGLGQEEKARRRTVSVWRIVDRACVAGNKRFLVCIKAGPNTINDDQVAAIKDAISTHHRTWLTQSQRANAAIREIDIVLGLTYGTPRTTNNKENQVLVKLLEHGFVEEDHAAKPGVLIDSATRTIRVYRVVGIDFWAFIGNPTAPAGAEHVFLEVLLGLSKALASTERKRIEDAVNQRIEALAVAIQRLKFPVGSTPEWMRKEFSDLELSWLAGAMSAFYDRGV